MAPRKKAQKYVSAEPNLDKDSREYHAMFGWPEEDENPETETSNVEETK
ncbi:hypothetical protein LCGC14_0376830 [marine sediment metagenome]|uniref:Uncharacterized protein n=1 Tax=marine sediment metagenome TaxID=412755 RepID=A0A0F9TLN9_9ZZZZ